MLILGIESTCDETAAAIVQDGCTVLSHALATSADIHREYGGVFPELACRRHIDAILPVIDQALQESKVSPKELDAIAVARGPGLIGALLIGVHAAKGLAMGWQKPLIGVNHVEAHLYAAMMNRKLLFPALGFVLSGGHTLMLKMFDIGHYELIGTTVDDAVGEAFDKAATILGLSYPGGPNLEKLALSGDASKFLFRAGNVKNDPFAFSFSGLKTAVLYAKNKASSSEYADIAASFQKTAFEDLVRKAEMAIAKHPFQSIIFGGGVTQNQKLRTIFEKRFPHIPQFWPTPGLSMDNAIMIAGLAFHRYSTKQDALDLEALSRNPFWESISKEPEKSVFRLAKPL